MGYEYGAQRTINENDRSKGINTKEFYDRNLLENGREKFIVSNFTAKKSIPKFEGDTAVFSYYDNIPAFSGPLAEGSSGSGAGLSKVNVRATVATYGGWIAFTDDVNIYGEDGARFIKDVTANLGGAAGETQEGLIFAAAIASNTAITFNTSVEQTLKDAETSIRKALGKKFTTMITGSTKYATSPIRPAYVGFVSVDGANILESTPGFISVERYGYSDGLLPNEVGSFKGMRICETTLLPQNAGKERMILMAEESIAEVGIRGLKKIESIINKPGSSGTSDPLSRNGTIGSKFRLGVAVLRPDWVCDVALQA